MNTTPAQSPNPADEGTKSRQMICFYVDDSGSRHPDHKPTTEPGRPDWFALGGVLVSESDIPSAEQRVADLRLKWPQMSDAPLHSVEIRNRSGKFRWLEFLPREVRELFYNDINDMMRELPITVLACVIDRPGYNARYKDRYGKERWMLCKTAFSIAVERAAKWAIHHDARLKIFIERSDSKTERRLAGYYKSLKTDGPPFESGTSAPHSPLDGAALAETLYDFKVKTKQSVIMQIADLALWPVCMGGYRNVLPFEFLRDARKLLDCHCEAGNSLKGIKYSCFDAQLTATEKQKPTEVGSCRPPIVLGVTS